MKPLREDSTNRKKIILQDSQRPPSGDSSPTPTKRGFLTLHRKEFKHEPELEIKGKFIREGIPLHRKRCGLLSKSENETPNVWGNGCMYVFLSRYGYAALKAWGNSCW